MHVFLVVPKGSLQLQRRQDWDMRVLDRVAARNHIAYALNVDEVPRLWVVLEIGVRLL